MIYEYVLLLTIITAVGTPDINKKVTMHSIEECWEAAAAWTQPEQIHKKFPTAIGIAAGCGIVEKPGTNS